MTHFVACITENCTLWRETVRKYWSNQKLLTLQLKCNMLLFFQWFRLVRKRDAKTWSGEYSQTFGVHDNITGSEEFDKAVNFQFGDVLILASGLNYDAVSCLFIA